VPTTNAQVHDALEHLQNEVHGLGESTKELRGEVKELSEDVGEIRSDLQHVKSEQAKFCQEQKRSAESHRRLHGEHRELRQDVDVISSNLALLTQNVELTSKLADNVHTSTNDKIDKLDTKIDEHTKDEIKFQRAIVISLISVFATMSMGFVGILVTLFLKFQGIT